MRRLYSLVFLLGIPAVISNPIRDALVGKSSLNDDSLVDFIEGMNELTRLQRKIFSKGVRHHAGVTDEAEAAKPDFLEGSLAAVNSTTKPWALPYLFEGDIILTPEQMNSAISYAKQQLAEMGGEVIEDRSKRTLTSSTYLRWTSFPIPFTISRGVNRTAVLAGIKLWQDNTCITFQENGQGRNSLQYIFGSGCYSNIGMIGGTQQISIGTGCDYPAIVGHETGHALGYYHEQARFDRDSFVRILTNNIQSGLESQFTKQSPSAMTTFGVQYDLGSVMHYDPYSFSRNGQPTIQTNDVNFQDTIGQRIELSFNDIKKMNFAYCNRTCSTTLPCQNSGYVDPKNCNQCRCPSGLGGTYCESPLQTDTNCGNLNLTALSNQQSLTQTGFGSCNYVITAQPGQQIAISIDNIRFNSFTPCESSYVEIKYGSDIGNTGARLCDNVGNRYVTSQTNKVVVLFRSRGSGSFSISYSAVGSGTGGGGGQTTTTQRPTTTSTPWNPWQTTTLPWWLTTTRPWWTTTQRPWRPTTPCIGWNCLGGGRGADSNATKDSAVDEHLESFEKKIAEAQIEGYKMVLGIADDFQDAVSDVIEEKRGLLLKKIQALAAKNAQLVSPEEDSNLGQSGSVTTPSTEPLDQGFSSTPKTPNSVAHFGA